MSDLDAQWFAELTVRAPEALRARVEEYFVATGDGDLAARLATAGDRALSAATKAGARRVAALDLLAADALITLALLLQAERGPASLLQAAKALRAGVEATA